MIDLKEIKELLKSMLPDEPVTDNVWKTRDGRRIHIVEMTDKHLVNTLLYCKRKTKDAITRLHVRSNWDSVNDRWRELLPPKIKAKFHQMEAEALKRGLVDWESRSPIRDYPNEF